MNDKELFKIFMKYSDDFERAIEIEKLIKDRLHKSLGEENAAFYDILRRLINSINNAGHEERRSQQISLINTAMRDICNKYEKFLP
jgi:hypothetical protein